MTQWLWGNPVPAIEKYCAIAERALRNRQCRVSLRFTIRDAGDITVDKMSADVTRTVVHPLNVEAIASR